MQRGVPQVNGPESVGEPSHEQLLELEPSAQSEAKVGRQCEVGAETQELLLVILQELVTVLVGVPGSSLGGNGRPESTRHRVEEVGHAMPDDLVELFGEGIHGLLLLGLGSLKALHEFEHVGMTPRQSLSDDLKGARHDVGPLHRDGDGEAHVGRSQIIPIAEADGRAGRDVHPPLDDAPSELGALLLHDGRDDHGSLVIVHNGVHEVDARDGREAVRSGEGHGLLYAPEFGDGDAELLPDARVRARGGRDVPCGPDGPGGEGYATPFGEALDEHVPSEATPVLPPEDEGHGNPDVLALDGPVHEGGGEGHVAGTHAEAGVVAPVRKGRF
mmetsp:Transcript_19288/g.56291  ORF Transcript_19288/g.56291 Transcript_19288/m.56291 type:complete len:330 (+) Transcript_19288:836-1825(+)